MSLFSDERSDSFRDLTQPWNSIFIPYRPNTNVDMVVAKSRRKQVASLQGKEIKTLFEEIDRRYKGKRRPTEKEILAEIQAYRKEKRSAGGV